MTTCSLKLLFCFVLCSSGHPSYAAPFLKTLLTTSTTPSTHISDFRNLPRSDSRANKPDTFPGFDFLDESTTSMRPRTPLDFYTKIIGGIVGQGRQTYERIVDNIQKYEINRRAILKRNSEPILEYIPVGQPNVFEASTTERMAIESTTELVDEQLKSSSKEKNWPKKYFSSILTSVGLNKLRNATDPEYLSKIIASTATYINPLIDVWKRATGATPKSMDSDKETFADQLNENIKPTSSSPASLLEVPKYSNLISEGYDDDKNQTISSLYNNNTELSANNDDDDVPWGDVNLNNNSKTMDELNDDVDFPIERNYERTDDDSDDDFMVDESSGLGYFDASNFGIFILEIFGTIAGLTWGLVSMLTSK